jgi:nicotinamide phosphoribosyltransferase
MTVGTTSWHVRQAILEALNKSADDPLAEINFKFHDFGSRGTPAMEASAFAGSAHLVSSMGTDTVVAVHAIEFAYGTRMAGYSIPATEHSTTTTHGKGHEIDLVKQMFDAYAKEGAIFATVADSYNVMNFIRHITPLFKDRLIESGATWVIRPDSGDPITTPIQCVVELESVFGSTINSKGYRVLNNVRVIQGDGIVPAQVTEILDALMKKGFSASNMAFGMGGGLLQKNNRDTHKFALKCSAVRVNGEWIDVSKDPAVFDEDFNVLDVPSFKASKAGRLELMYNPQTDVYKTVTLEEAAKMTGMYGNWEIALETVYEDGHMVRDMTFDEVRKNAGTL